MKYVQRRANRFEFRFPLPDDLAGKPAPKVRSEPLAALVNERTGRFKTELIRSLKTTDARAAERKALVHIAETHSLVDLARQLLAAGPSTKLTADQIASLVRNHEIAMLAADEQLRERGLGLEPGTPELASDGQGMTDLDLAAYGFFIDHLDGDLRQQAATMRVSTEARSKAESMLADHGVSLEPFDPARRKLELGLVAGRRRALDGIKARLRGDLVIAPEPLAEVGGIKLTAALARWSGGTAGSKPRPLTIAEATRAVGRFVELHGDLPIRSITKAHGREFRDAIAKLPKHLAHKHQRLGLPELLKAELSGFALRSPQTVNKILALLSGIMALAERDGYFDGDAGWSNPFYVSFEVPARNKQPYEPFSSDELVRLFGSPVFAMGERPRGGIADAAYWFPLIALYSGARRTEIAQLRVGDIRTSPGGVTFFDFNDEAEDKNLKNASSARSVPIHPELIRLGLLTFVEERRRGAGLDAALWTGFEPPIASKAKAWTKWFGRYLGIHVTESRAKTFHSFRHTFKRACREAGLTEEIHHAITGHAGGGVGRSYGRERRDDGSLDRGISIERLATELAKVRYPALSIEPAKAKT